MKSKMIKVALYLMTEKGHQVLNSLIDNGYKELITAVVSSRDSNVEEDYFESIKEVSISNKISFYSRSQNQNIKSDFLIAIGWRWLIKDDSSIITVHDSLLPKYRGFAPVVNALINGEKELGATMLFASENYDQGNIISQKSFSIKYPILVKEAIEMMSDIYIILCLDFFRRVKNDENIKGKTQNHKSATYSLWRDNEDLFIDWHWNADKIERFVNAVGYPYKGAKTRLLNSIVTIDKVEVIEDVHIENRTPGKQIFSFKGTPCVVCGKGIIKIVSAKNDFGEPFLFKKFRNRFF